ncbi:hypothetical protein KEM60_00833 [Austwickia sp. TVS 96-490-7B]|uniref:MOSC domain-containing protein n=1 Tax=Austwickia sp. TVS 96-490-7B TaxID=2830843 RepID=UPI001C571445|nr:MOSC domain-containing protein [Austwickia sp. TVS 96-490-7B]MBW3084644.1 hypothetical protein [Austwickia sp. TVS 96-490-7B]
MTGAHPGPEGAGRVVAVCLAAAAVQVDMGRRTASTGIAKVPVNGSVEVRAPGDRRHGAGSGLVGDVVVDHRDHGGDDQAVYAYAQEDLDHFAALMGRSLTPGVFGENLTTVGVDVSGAVVGERWRVGATLELVVRSPRIPCGVFRAWMGQPGWLKMFTDEGLPGTYLAVAVPGQVQAGDSVIVTHRPRHGVRISDLYRASMGEPERWPDLLARASDDLDETTRQTAAEAMGRLS